MTKGSSTYLVFKRWLNPEIVYWHITFFEDDFVGDKKDGLFHTKGLQGLHVGRTQNEGLPLSELGRCPTENQPGGHRGGWAGPVNEVLSELKRYKRPVGVFNRRGPLTVLKEFQHCRSPSVGWGFWPLTLQISLTDRDFLSDSGK